MANAPDAFDTARLHAERPRHEHLDALVALGRDERVAAWLGGTQNRPETRARLIGEIDHWNTHGFGRWIAFEHGTGELVGRCGLRRVRMLGRDEVELGYAVVAGRWGQGLATELSLEAVRIGFEHVGLDEIVAFTLPRNVASRRVLDKLAFTYERDFEWKGRPHVLYRIRRGSSSEG